MSQENWMSRYGDTTLGELHLPGSHDAGTTKHYIDKTAGGSDSNAATQSLTIAEQLNAGTRFFDLRLAEHKKRVVAHHTTGGQGAFSKISVDDVLQSAAGFCDSNRSEVVIFRISHTSLSTDAHEIAKASGGNSLHTGTGNLCTKTLKDILAQGGGLVCLFDEAKFGNVIDQSEGIHGYTKFTGAPNDRGISTCGCYSRTHKLDQVVCNGLRGQYEHNENHGNRHEHLWQVYWQKTYINPVSTTGIESGALKKASLKKDKVHGGTHAATSYLIGLMQGLGGVGQEDYEVEKEESHKEGWRRKKVVTKQAVMFSTLPVRNYSLPNIISYDFVNEDINRIIIAMNDKGLQTTQDI